MATLIGATLSIPAALTSATLLRRSWLALATQHSRRVVLLGASTRSVRTLASLANGPAIAEIEGKAQGDLWMSWMGLTTIYTDHRQLGRRAAQ